MTTNAGRVLSGRYRLIEPVGHGAQASVWRADHLALGTQVAVKLIDPELAKRPDARDRFKREANAAAQLRSAHVVQILDHGIDNDQPFIAMELLEGEDLFERLDKRERLSLRETSRIVTQVARALTRAHAAGIVHRDLKPENVFLVPNEDDEVAKVLDFGVAKVTDPTKQAMQRTRVGQLIGTPHYMSPEQVKGIGEVDYRTDLWAVGVIAYQCVTGELPFESEGVGDLLIQITIGKLPIPSDRLPGLPASFDAWFAKACARDAGDRFDSAKSMAKALATLVAAAPELRGPASIPRPNARIRRGAAIGSIDGSRPSLPSLQGLGPTPEAPAPRARVVPPPSPSGASPFSLSPSAAPPAPPVPTPEIPKAALRSDVPAELLGEADFLEDEFEHEFDADFDEDIAEAPPAAVPAVAAPVVASPTTHAKAAPAAPVVAAPAAIDAPAPRSASSNDAPPAVADPEPEVYEPLAEWASHPPSAPVAQPASAVAQASPSIAQPPPSSAAAWPPPVSAPRAASPASFATGSSALSSHDDVPPELDPSRRRRAVRYVAIAFGLVAVWIAYTAIRTQLTTTSPSVATTTSLPSPPRRVDTAPPPTIAAPPPAADTAAVDPGKLTKPFATTPPPKAAPVPGPAPRGTQKKAAPSGDDMMFEIPEAAPDDPTPAP